MANSNDSKGPGNQPAPSGFLKGNFEVKRDVVLHKDETTKSSAEKLQEEFRKKAMSSLGGSMVYVDRTQLTWDGDGSDEK